MKKIIIIILVFFAGKAIGQPIGYQPMNGGYQYKYLKVDSGFNIPNHDTVLWRGVNRQGAMVYKPNVGGGLFVYNGVSWDLVGGDLTPVWNAINNKVDSVTVTGDSLFYWVGGISYGYLFPNNNAIGLQTVITQGDSLTQNNVINGGQFNLNWDSLGQYTLTTYRANGTVSQYYQDSNMVRLQSRASIYRLENDTTTIESGKAINIQTPDNSLKISDDSTVFETTGTNVFKVKGLPTGAPLYAIGADVTGKFYLVDTAGGGGGGGSSWSLTGNTGLTGVNFLGTDNDTFNIKTNGYRVGFFDGIKRNNGLGQNTFFSNTTGSDNIAIGYNSLANNSTGNYNTSLGSGSLIFSGSGSNNIALGYHSGSYNTSGSNQLFINSLSNRYNFYDDTTKSLVYGIMGDDSAYQRFKINGKLHINDGTQGAGKVLTDINGDGIGSWQPVGGGSSWSLTGNSGTTSANFIGTTDAQPLVFKVNNTEVGRFATDNKISFGSGSTASGSFSTAMGWGSTASGFASTAIGVSTIASGAYSTTMGYATKSKGYNSTAMNWNTLSKSYAGTVIGSYNDTSDATSATSYDVLNRAFQIGIGDGSNPQGQNAMTVLFNGNVGIGTTTPTHLLHISAADSNVLRLQGLIEGLATDSMLTIDADGRVHKRVIPTGGGSSITPFQVILDADTTLDNTQAAYLFTDLSTSRTITLPASPTDGLEIQITSYWSNSDSYTLTIMPNTSQDIEGLTSGYVIGVKGTVKLKWYDNNASWQIINEKL